MIYREMLRVERHWKISSEYFMQMGTVHKGSIMVIMSLLDNENKYYVQ